MVDSAFLQPLHGYPSHYYNMTPFALRDLFQDLEIEVLRPASYQHPWFALAWILGRLQAGLDEKERSHLGQMTVDRFIRELKSHCEGRPCGLSKMGLANLEELAAGFTLIGNKP
jgi:hypothetical protein